MDGARWWGDFWKRLVGMVKSCLKKSIGSEKLSFTELLAVLFEAENALNNRPLRFVYDDDVSDVLTANCLLYGRNLDRENKILEEIDFGVIECNRFWERKCVLTVFRWPTRTTL